MLTEKDTLNAYERHEMSLYNRNASTGCPDLTNTVNHQDFYCLSMNDTYLQWYFEPIESNKPDLTEDHWCSS